MLTVTANFRFFAAHLRNHVGQRERFEMEDATNIVVPKPVGVGALITPESSIIPSVGRSLQPSEWVIQSSVPSELTPMTADLLMELFTKLAYQRE